MVPLMNEFVGRARELRFLQQQYDAEGSAFVPVYGRRRVGKSELLKRFTSGERAGIYFVGKQAPADMQRREFLEAAAKALGEPLLARTTTRSWKEALELCVQRWSGPRKLVLVLDEFQWTAAASPELPSVLQELWDTQWQHDGRVFLVLCGSFLGFMEREVLGSRSPLFGRRTGQIKLQPFDLREAREFHPHWSLAEVARARFVCGGIPLYLRSFQPDRSVEWNIRHTLLDEFHPLHREPTFLLREELRELPNYHAILMALAAGSAPLPQIAERTGLPTPNLGHYLSELVELGYVRRRYPLTARAPAKRHVRYVLEDPLLRFWFRFVFPHLSLLATAGPDEAFAEVIKPHLAAYWGHGFEVLCREALPLLYGTEGVRTAWQVGEFWSKEAQIDVVGLREDGWADLGECEWGASPSPSGVVAELARRAAAWPNHRGDNVRRWVFGREGLDRKRAAGLGVRWVGLEEMYG